MATNKNASFRYRVLNDCFRDGTHRWNIERLIEHVSDQLNEQFGIDKGISERQLKEDIHIMRSLPPRGFDAPIICREGVYYYNDPEFSIEKKALNTEDIRSLTEAVALLKQFRGLPHFEEIEAILTKIEGKTVTNDPDETIISFENTRLARGYEYLEPLYQAIRNEQVLSITYRAFQANTDEVFTLHPYYLKEYRQRWYVFGWVAEKDMIYNLALDRIQKKIEPTRKLFKSNLHFNPVTYFNDIVGVTRSANKDIETVLLKVHTNTAPYLETRPIHHTQQIHSANETDVTFQYKLIPNYEFIAEILRLGSSAQLLSPDSLRNHIAKQIAVLNVKYQDQLAH